ncbi:MAG: hypothetical protein ACYTFY_08280 [Planctomycetota bacterium]|jgi:hypothetical protein
MPIGKPHTQGISGHEAWIADTGEILFSAARYKVSKSSFVSIKEPEDEFKDMPAAALYKAAPGDTEPTPDNKYVIFNSVITGSAQVFAAEIPDGFLDGI